MSANIAIVRRMLEAWKALDVDGVLATMTRDARYHNVPLPLLEGQEAIGAWCRGFLRRVASFDVEMLAEGEADGIVFNERTDIIGYADGRRVAIRIAGVFRLRDGLIADWRDYFDLAQFENQLT